MAPAGAANINSTAACRSPTPDSSDLTTWKRSTFRSLGTDRIAFGSDWCSATSPGHRTHLSLLTDDEKAISRQRRRWLALES
jgi:hypothetical protein